jgi:N,N-dimethylformamidase beta subunit-like, C-terminal
VGQTRTIARGTRRGPVLRLRAPRGPSGLYAVELASGAYRTAALVPVQASGRSRTLLVLPVISWQARNRVDDDGDGMIDTLPRNGRARLDRPLAAGGVPPGFAANEEPLLRFLDRPQQRYDIATDVMLAGRGGTRLLGDHRGIVLAGLPKWLPPRVAARLRRFVEGGGRVFSPGVDSLRRTVVLRGSLLERPSRRRSPTDIFGATLAPIERRRVDIVGKDDTIGLFRGGDGLFNGFSGFEATLAPGPRAKVVAAGVGEGSPTPDPVIVALQVGDEGMVIRTGLPEWGRRLRGNPNVQALTRRAWTLLSR